MRASFIVAANALLVIGVAAAQSVDNVRRAADVPGTMAASARPAACRAAVWPYIPAECGVHGSARPVRVLRAEAGR